MNSFVEWHSCTIQRREVKNMVKYKTDTLVFAVLYFATAESYSDSAPVVGSHKNKTIDIIESITKPSEFQRKINNMIKR